MARHNETGKRGEQIAVSYLREQDFTILEINWRHRRAEIDIIAKEGAVLVFVEVKTRSSAYFGAPEAFVTAAKEDFLAEAANIYMEKIGHDW